MATRSSILAWRIPWTEEPGGLQSMGSQRVGNDWAINTHTHTKKACLFGCEWSAEATRWGGVWDKGVTRQWRQGVAQGPWSSLSTTRPGSVLTNTRAGGQSCAGDRGTKAGWKGEPPFLLSSFGWRGGRDSQAHQRSWAFSTGSALASYLHPPELRQLPRHGPRLAPHAGDQLLLIFHLLQDPGQFLLRQRLPTGGTGGHGGWPGAEAGWSGGGWEGGQGPRGFCGMQGAHWRCSQLPPCTGLPCSEHSVTSPTRQRRPLLFLQPRVPWGLPPQTPCLWIYPHRQPHLHRVAQWKRIIILNFLVAIL